METLRNGLRYRRASYLTMTRMMPNRQKVRKDVTILALRRFGNMPVLGFRRENVFHLVWVRPER